MKNVIVALMALALFNHGMARRILTDKSFPSMDVDFSKLISGKLTAINNASTSHTQTSGAMTAVGAGKTSISGSIGKGGAINNVNAEKGGHTQTSFGQVGNVAASSTLLQQDGKGNVKAISNASKEHYQSQGANESAFQGKGNASTGINKDNVLNNVNGSKAAASSSSFDNISKEDASSNSLDKNGKIKVHPKPVPKEEPVEEAPAEDAPAEDAPAEDAPAEDAPAEDAPAEEDTGSAEE